MLTLFAKRSSLAMIVGTKTPGRLISRTGTKVGGVITWSSLLLRTKAGTEHASTEAASSRISRRLIKLRVCFQ
jgi:hypothetical protein